MCFPERLGRTRPRRRIPDYDARPSRSFASWCASTEGKISGYLIESRDLCLLGPDESRESWRSTKILEVFGGKGNVFKVGRSKIVFAGCGVCGKAGLPVDLLPTEGMLEIQLGEENFGWTV